MMNRTLEKRYPNILALLVGIFAFVLLRVNNGEYISSVISKKEGIISFSSQLIQLLNSSFQASLVVPSVLLTAQSIVFSDDKSTFIQYLREADAYSCFAQYFTSATTHGFMLCLLSIVLLVISNCQVVFSIEWFVALLASLYISVLVLSIASTFRVLNVFQEYSLTRGRKGKQN